MTFTSPVFRNARSTGRVGLFYLPPQIGSKFCLSGELRVREWPRGLLYRYLFGGWTVKVVNEFDRCTRDILDLLPTMLDRMPAGHAFLATTNLDIGSECCLRFLFMLCSVSGCPPNQTSHS